jgi:hypothetical protein
LDQAGQERFMQRLGGAIDDPRVARAVAENMDDLIQPTTNIEQGRKMVDQGVPLAAVVGYDVATGKYASDAGRRLHQELIQRNLETLRNTSANKENKEYAMRQMSYLMPDRAVNAPGSEMDTMVLMALSPNIATLGANMGSADTASRARMSTLMQSVAAQAEGLQKAELEGAAITGRGAQVLETYRAMMNAQDKDTAKMRILAHGGRVQSAAAGRRMRRIVEREGAAASAAEQRAKEVETATARMEEKLEAGMDKAAKKKAEADKKLEDAQAKFEAEMEKRSKGKA